jgi:hypothetical protein
VDTPISPPHTTSATLQPRYRRLHSFGDLLDESVRLYRQHFVCFALISAIALLPSGLILVWASAAGLMSSSLTAADFQAGGRFGAPGAFNLLNAQLQQQVATGLIAGVISALFGMAWTAALVVTSDAHFRGEEPGPGWVYRRALKRILVVLVSTVLFFLGLLALSVLATIFFILTVFGLVGSLIALVGLLVWWLRPTARRTWLKWLIILTTPYGLPTYYAFRWAMYIAAIVLEGRGPTAALRRSSQLATGQWFRVSSILTIAPLLVGLLVGVLAAMVNIPLGLVASSRGQLGLDPASAAISSAVSIALQILFSSLAVIAYTLLFTDLRNRREGTDIVERLSQLEAAPTPANG